MSYRSDTVATVIGRLNNQYFLPAIQREFVWKPEQIIQLFDSIVRGYPISSFLFWELEPENRDKWEAYRFIDAAVQGGTHNTPAGTDGVLQLTLVLDGQQRLTSLLVGLKGTYNIKKKYKRWDNPDAWSKCCLYLDLLKDPKSGTSEEGNGEAGIYYGFGFHESESAPPPGDEHFWFKVGRILDCPNDDAYYDLKQTERERLPGDTVTLAQARILEKNLDRLYQSVWKDQVIAYYTEHDQDYDRVLDIFVRANEGGTKLSKSDLLLSMVTSKWGGVNARDEIYGFVDRVNTDLTRRNDLDKDFVMKACLVLTDLPVAYRVQNFSNENLALIQSRWKDIKRAVERGVDLANYFGIDRDNLTSANALIPAIYYLLQRPGLTLRGSSQFEVRNALAVRRWLVMALLNQVFGGASDNILRDIRGVLQKHAGADANFPVKEINDAIGHRGRTATFDEYAIDNVLSLTYGRRLTFLALTLLYDECGWGTMSPHQDHIFPRSALTPSKLEEAGFDTAGQRERHSLRDRLANLELLLPHENQEKADRPFEEWLASRDHGFKQKHLIPDDPSLWRLDRFPDFVKAREDLIKRRLQNLFGVPEGNVAEDE